MKITCQNNQWLSYIFPPPLYYHIPHPDRHSPHYHSNLWLNREKIHCKVSLTDWNKGDDGKLSQHGGGGGSSAGPGGERGRGSVSVGKGGSERKWWNEMIEVKGLDPPICIYVYVYIFIGMNVYVCMYILPHKHTRIQFCVCVYLWMFVFIHVHVIYV